MSREEEDDEDEERREVRGKKKEARLYPLALREEAEQSCVLMVRRNLHGKGVTLKSVQSVGKG